MKKYLLLIFLTPFIIWGWTAPTDSYIALHSLEEIKYNLRLEHVTLENKTLYDKAVSEEALGFFGYYGTSAEFRVYQDIIRIIFEEVLKINIPDHFHFLAVPLYPERKLQKLEEIPSAFFEGIAKPYSLINQLFPINVSLYANHKTHGYSPIKGFALSTKHANIQDLYWLLATLGMDQGLIEKAFSLATFKENSLLLQFFDTSYEQGEESYSFIDSNSYPAFPSGHPFRNSAISDDIFETHTEYPPQYFLLLNDHAILNPKSPLVVKRYAKVQPSKIKAYEQALRELIKSATFDVEGRDHYISQLNKAYS